MHVCCRFKREHFMRKRSSHFSHWKLYMVEMCCGGSIVCPLFAKFMHIHGHAFEFWYMVRESGKCVRFTYMNANAYKNFMFCVRKYREFSWPKTCYESRMASAGQWAEMGSTLWVCYVLYHWTFDIRKAYGNKRHELNQQQKYIEYHPREWNVPIFYLVLSFLWDLFIECKQWADPCCSSSLNWGPNTAHSTQNTVVKNFG